MVWCNPPCIKKIIIKCFNKCQVRKIKGYLVIPKQYQWFNQKWIADIKKKSITYIDIEPFKTKKFSVSICFFNFI